MLVTYIDNGTDKIVYSYNLDISKLDAQPHIKGNTIWIDGNTLPTPPVVGSKERAIMVVAELGPEPFLGYIIAAIPIPSTDPEPEEEVVDIALVNTKVDEMIIEQLYTAAVLDMLLMGTGI